MDKQASGGPRKNLEDLHSPPILTGILVFGCLLMYWIPTQDRSLLTQYGFQSARALLLFESHDYSGLGTMLLFSNFAQLALWQMLGNIYFIWLFGGTVERRLGVIPYLILISLGSTLPWLVQAWDGSNLPWLMIPGEHGFKTFVYFVGPSLLAATIAGAYVVLAPRKKMEAHWGRPSRGIIFRNEKEKPANEKFGLSPTTFVGAFVIFQVATHYFISVSWKGYDSAGLLAGATAGFLGYLLTTILLQTAIDDAVDGKMKLEAVKRYNELLKLDVNSDEAMRGVARAMGVPVDQVRIWIAQGKGRLRVN